MTLPTHAIASMCLCAVLASLGTACRFDFANQDNSSPADANLLCEYERILPIACTASSTVLADRCTRLFDAREFGDPPSILSFRGGCDGDGGPDYCAYDAECSNGGCIRDLWISFDLGFAAPVERIRYLADYWAKRPDEWELWVSDDPLLTPDNGATRAAQGVGTPNAWKCEDGQTCADETVPDECCPDGRDQPQNTVNVGDIWPKFDILDFSVRSGRYWYFLIKNTRDRDALEFFEVELFRRTCT